MDRRKFLKVSAYSGGLLLGNPLFLPACSGKRDGNEPQPRLVLLFATCSVSQSYLSPYNKAADYTPNIARFAAESSVFTRHQTEAGLSGIAYASILSGNQADKHGIFDHPRRLDETVWLISEAFAQNDYDPYFWDGHLMAKYHLGYGQGVPPGNSTGKFLVHDDSRFDAILKRVSSDRSYKAFVLVTGMVTHNPYSLDFRNRDHNPETLPSHFQTLGITSEEFYKYRSLYFQKEWSFRIKYDFENTIREWDLSGDELKKFIGVVEYLYKCGIHVLDRRFGNIIRKLAERDLLDKSLVVFTSDHGEILYRDNTFFKFCHGHQLTPEVLTVPLIIRSPSLGARSKRHSFVSRSIDVFPTIAGLCRLSMPEKEKPDGIDLTPVMRGHSPPMSIPAFSHTGVLPEIATNYPEYQDSLLRRLFPQRDPNLAWVSVRIEDMLFKYAKIKPDREDLAPFAFDLARDPTERQNIFDHNDEYHRKALNKLKQYKASLISAYRSWYSTKDSEIPEKEKIETLKSLGYI
jgi:arylsulfatase A-like enzyme